jgi:integrase
MTRLGRSLGNGTLRKVQRGGTAAQYVLEWTDATGQRHRQALSTDRRVAERRQAEIIRHRDLEEAGLGAVEGMSMPLTELRDLYLADLKTHSGAKHLRKAKDSLARVLSRISATRVRDVRVIDVLKFRAQRLREGVSNNTANFDSGVLRGMLNFGVSAQLILENPLRGLKQLPIGERHQKHVRRALSDDEISRFLSAADQDDRRCEELAPKTTRVPQRLLWQTLIETGARWGELTHATWADLDANRRCVALRATTTKSGKSRTIPLRAELLDALLALRAVHQRARRRVVQPTDRVFVTPDGANHDTATTGMRRIFRRVLECAGIDRKDMQGRVIDIHGLRGTCASRLVRNRVPVAVTQRMLGHSSPAMTMKHYVHLELDDMRGAVEGVRPTLAAARTETQEKSA